MNYRPAQNIVFTAGRFLIGLAAVASLLNSITVQKAAAFDYPRLPNRSLSIGDTTPGATTDYSLTWQYPTGATVGSIRFNVCTDGAALDTCTAPVGTDTSAATLTSQSGVTGFSILSQTTNEIILSRPPSAGAPVSSNYIFDGITNPSGVPDKFYVRIYTYPTADGTGAPNEISSVVNATTQPINISTIVPPILYFCAAISIDDYCVNVVGNQIDYGTLSSVSDNAAISEFGVATNAVGGYIVTINGNTMTSGNKLIPALNTAATSSPGTGQFGLNLRANSAPAMGSDAAGAGVGVVDPDYDVPDQFIFNNGDVVASAATGSLFNTFTTTYIVNVPPDQPAGVYTTTIAYICSAAF